MTAPAVQRLGLGRIAGQPPALQREILGEPSHRRRRDVGLSRRQLASGEGGVTQGDEQPPLPIDEQQVALIPVALEDQGEPLPIFSERQRDRLLPHGFRRTGGGTGDSGAQPLAEVPRPRRIAAPAKGAQESGAGRVYRQQPVDFPHAPPIGAQHEPIGGGLANFPHDGAAEQVRARRRG